MVFRIGEKVVYPNQGVGIIENVGARWFGAQHEQFYLLRLLCTSLTVLVPRSHVAELGLRKVTRNGEVAKVLSFLSNGSCRSCPDWKDRFKVNSEKMKSGRLLETAEVLKSLLLLQASKPLSFREKKILDRARHMLIAEIAVSRSIPEIAAEEMLMKTLLKASLSFPAAL